MIRPLFASVFLLSFTGTALAAPPPDVADLYPATTLAYAELHNPAELGPQLAALFKGTPLEDSIALVEGKRGSAKTIPELNGKRELAELALLVSPEVLAEFRKLGGVAVGLVGFSERGEPEAVLAVLTGESAAAGLAARAFLTTSASLRKVAEVSTVPVFQSRPPVVRYGPDGTPNLANDKPPTEGAHEPTYAYTPGLFVVGTSKSALEPVIKRFRGEQKGTLRDTEGFRAAAEHRRSGLFFYANTPELFAKVDAAGRARGEPFDSALLAWVKITTNQKALRSVAGCVQLRAGGLSLTVGGKFDPALKSPLLDFFSGPPVKVDALYHARKPASFAATVNLLEKNRGAVLVGFLDAVAKANGELGRLPGDVVKELQEKHKIPVTDGLLARVRAVTVVVPASPELPKGARPIPLLALHLDDAAAAGAWEEFLPKLVGDLTGERALQPSSETVAGVKVLSLPGTGLPWKSAVHYARKDAVLAIGQDRKLVAAAVAPDAATSVAGGAKPLSVPAGDLALLGTLNLGALFTAVELPATTRPGHLFAPPLERLGEVLPPDEPVNEADKARAAFLTAFGELPPAVVAVRRSGDELRLEVFQPNLQNGALTPVINAGVNWFDKLMGLRNDGPVRGEQRQIYGKW